MRANTKSLTKGVADLVEPILEEMGFEMVDVEYLSYQGRWVVRLTIDKEGGITIDDCARTDTLRDRLPRHAAAEQQRQQQ